MNLGLFLSPGDSLESQSRSGQLERLIEYYLKPYAKNFSQVYLFSYGDKKFSSRLPTGIQLITKPWPKEILKQVDVFRVFQAVGGLPALLSGKPYVVTYGYDYVKFAQIEGKRLVALVMKLMLPIVLSRAQKIIITTKDSLSLLGSWKGKAVLLPNGVDPDIFKPGKEKEQFLVLSVGRIVKQKNHSLLIKIVSKSKYQSKIKLVIIGEGPLKKNLLRQAKTLGIKLKIIDNMPHRKLVNWYQKATLFALTSKTEGQAKALLEALSCELPCLTTRFSGNPLVGYAKNDLTNKLDQLLTSQNLRKKLGKENRNLVITNFDLKKIIKKEISLLKQIP